MLQKPHVIVMPYPRAMGEIYAAEDLARLEEIAEVIWGRDEMMPQEEFEAALPEAVAIVHGRWAYGGGETLGKAPQLRAVIENMGGHGQAAFDYDYCFAHGIRVLSCSPAFGPQVAEMALGLAIAAARGIPLADRLFRSGQEVYQRRGNVSSFMLYEQPVGLVGLGALGRSLLPLLSPFHCHVSVYDPWLPASLIRRSGCKPATLEDVLANSRVIFVLAAPTTENQRMIGRELLETIRPDGLLVLISRAHVVDFDALTELVLADRFRAAIDVFPQEPLPLDHPIRQAEGAVLSAHRAGSVPDGHLEIGRMIVDDLELILRGMPPRVLLRAEPELVAKTIIRR